MKHQVHQFFFFSSLFSAVKQEQSEKKNAALGETVHEMEELSGKLKQKLKEEDDALSKADKANREKSYEITSLKNQVAKFEEQIVSVLGGMSVFSTCLDICSF